MSSTDNTGNEILEVIAKADQFNRWMYQAIKPFLTGSILEIGSGIGNISSLLIENDLNVALSDTDPYYIETLKNKFCSSRNLTGVFTIDLMDTSFSKEYNFHIEKYDTIFLLNVLEHIPDDKLAINNCTFLLKPGGKLIVLTPAYPFLFSSLDKALGHYRRYKSRQLIGIFQKNDLEVEKIFHFNSMGMIAWLYAKIRRLKTIPKSEMGLFNKIVPLSKFLDIISFRKIGLSVIIVATKKDNSK